MDLRWGNLTPRVPIREAEQTAYAEMKKQLRSQAPQLRAEKLALALFGDAENAARFMNSPHPILWHHSPRQAIADGLNWRRVDEMMDYINAALPNLAKITAPPVSGDIAADMAWIDQHYGNQPNLDRALCWAIMAFDNKVQAVEFMLRPNARLSQQTPLQACLKGQASQVEAMLGRIIFGIYS